MPGGSPSSLQTRIGTVIQDVSSVSDMLAGAAALAAEYNGVEDVSHIRDELSEIVNHGLFFQHREILDRFWEPPVRKRVAI